jgi:hypothetical protein
MNTAGFSKLNMRESAIESVQSSTKPAVRKKAARKGTRARSPQKERNSRPKPEQLVCRYCGSDDLAPSFVKRRDRRCRKCFSKRYGSRAQPKRKAKK